MAACVTAFAAYRNSKNNGRVLVEQKAAIQEVHVLVNSRLTTVLERVEQLTHTLESEGISVPAEPVPGGPI